MEVGMLDLFQLILILTGMFMFWIGLGYIVETFRSKCWPVLLWSQVFLVNGFRIIVEAFGVKVLPLIAYILISLSLIGILIFLLKFQGLRILNHRKISARRLLLFWE